MLSRIQNQSGNLETASLDDLRELLIYLGQLEQGLADCPSLSGHMQEIMRLTDLAATAFCQAYRGETGTRSSCRAAILNQRLPP
ncbi:MAG: hypothetical protein JWM68_842, partial [Verrucomicrobiales bacterium]|nr:hypothetical protein [Verrucomicrobiales bacterium]